MAGENGNGKDDAAKRQAEETARQQEAVEKVRADEKARDEAKKKEEVGKQEEAAGARPAGTERKTDAPVDARSDPRIEAQAKSYEKPEGEVRSHSDPRVDARTDPRDPRYTAGVGSDTRNVPGSHIPTEAKGARFAPRSGAAPDAKSDTMADTAVHNAGNAGPISDGTDRSPSVRVAPLPGGLLPASAEPLPHPGRSLAPKPVDADLVAHTGMAHGMTAAEDAAVSHFRMRMGEMRNFMRDFDPALLGEGSEMHELALQLQGAFDV